MNSTSTNPKTAIRLSFYELFEKLNFKIAIPILQRDYAQGRVTTHEVRNNFLEALYKYLNDGIPFRDLDFVYGSIVGEKDKLFVPLDGQQRLTTLFLLHWYLALISDNLNNFRSFIQKDGKSRFTYETRVSSSEFCDSLITKNISLNGNQIISEIIKDSDWYFMSWKFDPTIQAMLVMLDAIQQKFNDRPEFYNLLVDDERPVITFLFLNLQGSGLTDDLYIKMNARGKPLTQYENFKAKIEQHLGLIGSDKPTYTLTFTDCQKKVSLKNYFSHNIDTKWADLFWNYRYLVNSKHDVVDNNFDDEIMNFIRVFLTNEYATLYKYSNNNGDIDPIEYLIGSQTATKKQDYTDNLSYNNYISYGLLNNESLLRLVDALDVLANKNEKIKKHLSHNFYFGEESTFEKALKHQLTLEERLQFHAYLQYLILHKENTNGLYDWMRVIHNLTVNSEIDSGEDFVKALKSINTLLPQSGKILDYLKSKNVSIDFFYGGQTEEERIKAHLITKNGKWYELVSEIESHEYLTGQIAFILEFSGILDYYKINRNCDWSEEEDIEFRKAFISYSEKASYIFNNLYKDFNRDFIWERSVLVKGDYLIQAGNSDRFNFLSTNKNIRDYSWKRLLRMSAGELMLNDKLGTNEWAEKRNYVKEVLDDIDPNDYSGSIKEILKNGTDDWRNYFIKESELIRYCLQGFIRFRSEDDILLYKHTKTSQYHHEMYTYHMYQKMKEISQEFMPFNVTFFEVRSVDESSCLLLNDFVYKRISYNLEVYYDEKTRDLPGNYHILFTKSRGNLGIENYPDEIKAILDDLKFKWIEEYKGFWIARKTEKSAIESLKEICAEINKCISVSQLSIS